MTNWDELILEYKKGTIQGKKICEIHKLNYNSFRYYLKKYTPKTDSFIRIKAPEVQHPLEIMYPNGVRILVNQNLSSEQLKALIYV